MPDVYLKDPGPEPAWFPFQDTRPICELRAGAWLIRERWEAIAEGETRGIFAPEHLHAFTEDRVPQVGPAAAVEGPAIVGCSNFAPTGVPLEVQQDPARLVNDEGTVGWWVPEGTTWTEDDVDGWEPVEVEGVVLRGSHDLITALEHFLVADVTDFTHEGGDQLPDGCVVIGDPGDVVLLGALVEPGVTFDVREGAVVVEQHAYVKSGTRFEGPVYVGPGTEVMGGQVRWCAVGPRCKIRGEITSSVFLGFANKAHDGFIGHSVIGRWVNLGAGTVTSNLKNTFGNIRIGYGEREIDTERQNLGSLIGDHAKTAIGTLLNTGTLIGPGANVFGTTRPPKFLPPFAWGVDGNVMQKQGFLAVAERVLPRRNVEVTAEVRSMLETIYDHATAR